MRRGTPKICCILTAALLTLSCSKESGEGQPSSGGAAAGGAPSSGADAGGAPSSAGAGGDQAGGEGGAGDSVTGPEHWVGTWGASQQLTEPDNNPPEPGLANNTLRQRAYVSIGGSELRIQLSNEFGDAPVTMNSVHVAVSQGGAGIDPNTDRTLTFAGSASVTIPAGEAIYSDTLAFELPALSSLAITTHYGEVPTGITGHPGARTSSYLMEGDALASATFEGAVSTAHWYHISRIEVMAPASAAAIVTLGDSLTDGFGSRVNHDTRWPDYLSRRLRATSGTEQVSVINAGIGGNALVSGGLGPTALDRFERDVISQEGVRWVIVLEGINDIGWGGTASNLIAGYEELIAAAHAADLLIYGVPLLPFGGSNYDSVAHAEERQVVNDWIRSSGAFDAVIDVEAAVADPENPTQILPGYTPGDLLHLNMAGYEAMANAIDLTLFQ